ncbi:MAG TPA: DNA recombination protein RmuC [Acidimicrobiales bacterium]|nr:DNA recombination protein RmuC [Acidimicrobiales bacterium]
MDQVIAGLAIGLAVGAVAGTAVAWTICSARAAARMAAQRSDHEAALAAARAEAAALGVALERERTGSEERRSALEDLRQLLAGEFAELSRRALTQNSSQFLDLADARMREAQQQATGDLEQRRQAIEQLLSPLRDQLGKYEQGLRLLELERQRAYSQLSEQVRQLNESQDKLQLETRNLVTALRSPATRGRWGEMQLRRVVEMAGMLEHCDFEEQVSAQAPDGLMRPDLVVRLPGAKQVVVDAKVPLQAFLDANEATDEDARRAHMQAHARQLRSHVDALSKKAYWQQFADSPEFVVAFVPGDPLLAAAFEHDPTLLEHAVANHVLLATPTTLIALLRAVAYGWQSEALADNAREVQQLGRELYRRLSTFGEHMGRTGRSLKSAVDAYNKAVGSLEHSVLPQARRFSELGVIGDAEKDELVIEPLDAVAREVRAPELSAGAPALELVGRLHEGDDHADEVDEGGEAGIGPWSATR